MIVNGWIDWAERRDGIPDKVYSAPCQGLWLTCHSVVGQESEFQDGIPDRFLSTARGSDGRYLLSAAASVKFIGRKNGLLIQMYPMAAATWTSGGPEANIGSDAIEEEGGGYHADGTPNFSEPLTPAQEDTFIRLYTELEAYHGWDPARPQDYLKQHKDVARQFGYDATSCASDRYANAWARIFAGERYGDDLSAEDKERIDRLERIVAGNHLTTEVWDGNIADLQAVGISHPIVGTVIGLTGEAALKYADLRGFSFALGVKLAQDAAAEAKEMAETGGGRHTHRTGEAESIPTG